MRKMFGVLVMILSLGGAELALAQNQPPAQSSMMKRASAEAQRNDDADNKQIDHNCPAQDETRSQEMQACAEERSNAPYGGDAKEGRSDCVCTQGNYAAHGDPDAPQNQVEYGGGG